MTQETDQLSSLHQWWNSISFEGKNDYQLNEKGELVLAAKNGHKERVVGTLQTENADVIFRTLTAKFSELEARLKELQHEWNTADDKLKLHSRVERLADNIYNSHAVGNYAPVMALMDQWKQELANLTKANSDAKQKITTEAEALAAGEDWKGITQQLRDLAEQFKKLPAGDKHHTDTLWQRFENARNRFYERKRLNQEEMEKDMLGNLDLKMEIVEKAEANAASENWKETTELFKQLMEQWKSIGRISQEKNDDLWNRLIAAKNVFYEKKLVHFETIQQEQEINYNLKLALVERAEALKDSTEWQKTIQAFADIMEEWKKAGKVPLDKADELWKRLNDAKDVFFNNKRLHSTEVKRSLDENYEKKLALVIRAEELKNSTRWREATEEINTLMDEWKKIGPVPREHNNTTWERFITARKSFFERKDADRERRKQYAEQQQDQRMADAKHFVTTLQNELVEEEENLADFRNSIQNITPGKKTDELRAHLTKLIAETEKKITIKKEKLERAQKQLEEKEQKNDTPESN